MTYFQELLKKKIGGQVYDQVWGQVRSQVVVQVRNSI